MTGFLFERQEESAAQYNFCGGAKFVTVCINVSKPKPA